MPEFDYRSMLARYLHVVMENEGTDFLPDPDFTEAEVAEMRRLAAPQPPVSFRRKSVLLDFTRPKEP